MSRHVVYVALTFEVDEAAPAQGASAAQPVDVMLVDRLLQAVDASRLRHDGIELVAPHRAPAV
ncbi:MULTISPECIES: hypothetical protein [unclassified Agrococcus]|uniref:hypothetical protein n=1 Tax=unclassified Agrococcus TaxID=2615065 RepID=UPI003620362D